MSELIKSVTNNYDGVSIRDFLKEELGLRPDEYNKLWKSLTD